ncbi:MAG: N-acetylmuramoyl-L-alanine amidase [bacterium]|nr:N-acetylmuramoyl-L-alanine amidase [bacterium]
MKVCICLMTVGLGGCNLFGLQGQDQKISTGLDGTIAVSEMGGRLGLVMRQKSSYSATMGNRFNSVVFFSDPGGMVYVNGRELPASGGVVTVGETIYVPKSLEPEIRREMANRPIVIARSSPRRPSPLRRSPPSVSEPKLKYGPVIIDAGHGGRDPGTSHNGFQEKDIVLDVALMVAQRLRVAGVDARLTRSTDTFVELNERAALAKKVGAKLFVSLHCDSAPNRKARGFTIYAPRDRMGQTSLFASVMEKSILTTNMSSRGIRGAGFRVLARTTCPALLVEMGYLSNRYEAKVLGSKSFKRAIATAVANAVIGHLTK